MADIFTRIISANPIKNGNAVVVSGKRGGYSIVEPAVYEPENSGQYLDSRLVKPSTESVAPSSILHLSDYQIGFHSGGVLVPSTLMYHALNSGIVSSMPIKFYSTTNGGYGNPHILRIVEADYKLNTLATFPAYIGSFNHYSVDHSVGWKFVTRVSTQASSITNFDVVPNGGLRLYKAHVNPSSSGGTSIIYVDKDDCTLKSIDESGYVRRIDRGGIVTDSDAATITFNCNSGLVHRVTLGGNRTLAVSNVKTGDILQIKLTQDGTGNRTVTWFSTISWAGGSAPTLTTTGNKSDWITIICTGNGTYDGGVAMANV